VDGVEEATPTPRAIRADEPGWGALLEDLLARKGDRRVSVCVPARNEAATITGVLETVRRSLMDQTPLVDELVVVDDGSTDQTVLRAWVAGARVVDAADGPGGDLGPGKGHAMWVGLAATSGDLVVFCDADVVDFGPHFVTGLLEPLLVDDDVALVKGTYRRPGPNGDTGGRVTELLARPLLDLLFPDLARIRQPLAGETAGRRSVLERVPFAFDYGVEIGLLLDVAALAGPAAVAQVDLGTRTHRNRALLDLRSQASEVLTAALARSGVPGIDPVELPPLVSWPQLMRRA